MIDRDHIRQHARIKRNELSLDEQHHHAEHLKDHIKSINCFQEAKHVGFYYAFDHEVDPHFLMDLAWAEKKTCYLPILHPAQPNELLFMPYKKSDALIKNRYGIPEPPYDPKIVLRPIDLQLVFTPLVAFDKKGNRLGMGAGYYDRSFAFLQEKALRTTRLIGLAYECQEVPSIPAESWDVPLDAVLTEKQFVVF